MSHNSRLNVDSDPAHDADKGIIKLSNGIFTTAQQGQFHQFLLIAKEVASNFYENV